MLKPLLPQVLAKQSIFNQTGLTLFLFCSLLHQWQQGANSICLTWWSSGMTQIATSRS